MVSRNLVPGILLGIIGCASALSAQQAPPPPDPDAGLEASLPVLAARTLVPMELRDAISTKTARTGDYFDLRTTEPVLAQGRVAIPAGTRVVGQIIDAQKPGAFGSPAKLLLAIRYAEAGGIRIPLSLSRGTPGKDKSSQALALAVMVGVFSAFLRGDQIVLPAGTPLTAKVAKDTPFEFPPSEPPAADPAAPTPGAEP